MLKFYRKNLRERWKLSDYKIDQLISDGILSEGTREGNRHRYWTAKQVMDAEKRIEARSAKVYKIDFAVRGFNKKHRAQIQARG